MLEQKPVRDMNDAEVQRELTEQYTKHALEETVEIRVPRNSDGGGTITPRELLRLYRALDTSIIS